MTDKYLHCIISAVLVILLSIFLPVGLAILITLIIGMGKEYIIDLWFRKTKADWYDILADCVGILIGSLLIILI